MLCTFKPLYLNTTIIRHLPLKSKACILAPCVVHWRNFPLFLSECLIWSQKGSYWQHISGLSTLYTRTMEKLHKELTKSGKCCIVPNHEESQWSVTTCRVHCDGKKVMSEVLIIGYSPITFFFELWSSRFFLNACSTYNPVLTVLNTNWGGIFWKIRQQIMNTSWTPWRKT